MLGGMTIRRMDNVGIVVDNLAAGIAFFAELGLKLEVETTVEGRWVDRVVGLDGVRTDIAMMRTPDGHGQLELMKFQRPTAVSAEPKNAPANTVRVIIRSDAHEVPIYSAPRYERVASKQASKKEIRDARRTLERDPLCEGSR
jgi:catechol 2,3-dioxygenase-like lactoylglutathione lyase family enzyme